MKTFTLILSLFMLFKPVLPVVEYVVFYDYIKNELCVNKEKPELECNGKCHLSKELAKVSESEHSKDKNHTFSLDTQISYCEAVSPSLLIPFVAQRSDQALFSYSVTYSFSFSSLVFKPPVSRL